MNEIHPTAIVSPDCVMGDGNQIGPFCYIGPRVVMGDRNKLVSHVCIGTPGQYRGRDSLGGVSIGSGNVFREFSQVQAAMEEGASTVVGDCCYLMKGAHVAHDCVIADGVTMCNDATLGGGVRVDEGATLGFLSVVHQEQRIGAYAMLGMGTIVPKAAHVQPGETYAGNPARHISRNLVGLQRAKVDRQRLAVHAFPPPQARSARDLVRDLAEELEGYMRSRGREYQPRRYEIAARVRDVLPYLGENDAAHLYNMAFSLCWQQHEDFLADQVFIRELLIEPMGRVPPAPPTSSGGVAWLVNHVAVGTYAPYRHVHAYLSGMEPCHVYVHGNVREREVRELQGYGHDVTQFHGAPSDVADAIAKRCAEDGIGALISDIYLGVPLLVFQRRAAPLQCYLSPGFQLFPADLVLLPETQEIIPHPRHRTEFIPTAVLKKHLYRQTNTERRPCFGVLTRGEKMSRAYLETVCEILDATGAEFYIFGRATPEITHPQFRVMGIQDPHEALDMIGVYLDTYPTCGGLSVFEAMAHGTPVISLDHDSVKTWNVFKPCTVQTREEYIAAALRAYRDSGYAAEIATAGRETVAARLTNVPRGVAGLYRALERAGWQR